MSRLAVDGGEKIQKTPFPQWPKFDRNAERSVIGAMRSGKVNYWTGLCGRNFESAWSKWLGCRNAITVSNGTAALHLALTALGVGSGDEVICTSYSFIASSFCALQAGAIPVFCDVGEDHIIDPSKIEPLITKRTKAIVVVHLYGMVADMDPIMSIAKAHGLFVVEDCAQCIGGVYKGRKAGTIGDAGCFSFCHSKQITTGGEGGMVCCNNDALAWTIRSLRDHGTDVKAKLEGKSSTSARPYSHIRVGYNFRMTELQSAIGLSELARYDEWNLVRRRKLGRKLVAALSKHPLVKFAPVDTDERVNSYWLAPFVLKKELLTVSVSRFIEAVQAEGVGAYAIFWPEMYREDAYVKRVGFGGRNYPFNDPANGNPEWSAVDCPVARKMASATIAFWTHPTYTMRNMDADIKAFRKVACAYMKH